VIQHEAPHRHCLLGAGPRRGASVAEDLRTFEAQVDRLRVAAGEEIKNFDLPRVVELTMRATGLTGDGKKNSYSRGA
jgi:hypothetical protein